MYYYLGVLRVLDDSVAVERRAVVHLQDGGKAGGENNGLKVAGQISETTKGR